jgi:hypothetical protein
LERCFRFALQQIFQTLRALSLGLENEVAALKDRANVAKAEILGEVAQGGHGNLLVTSEINRPEQSNKLSHLRA